MLGFYIHISPYPMFLPHIRSDFSEVNPIFLGKTPAFLVLFQSDPGPEQEAISEPSTFAATLKMTRVRAMTSGTHAMIGLFFKYDSYLWHILGPPLGYLWKYRNI